MLEYFVFQSMILLFFSREYPILTGSTLEQKIYYSQKNFFLCFLFPKNMANFEACLKNISFSINIFFLKSVHKNEHKVATHK